MGKNKKEEKRKDKKPRDLESIKTILLLIMLVLCVVGSIVLYYVAEERNKDLKLAYTELIGAINNGEVEKIEMTTGSSTVTVVMHGEGEEKDREKNIISGNARKSSLKYDTDYIMDKLYDYLRTL